MNDTVNSSLEIVTKTSFFTFFTTEFYGILFDLRWMILLGIILILVDLRFGISASRLKGVEIRRSRAWRRTMNKFIDYLCYILLGAILGQAIGQPYGISPEVISVTVILLCYCFELDSIYSNVRRIHGIEKNLSIWKILWLLLSFKFKALGEAFKDLKNLSIEEKNIKETKD